MMTSCSNSKLGFAPAHDRGYPDYALPRWRLLPRQELTSSSNKIDLLAPPNCCSGVSRFDVLHDTRDWAAHARTEIVTGNHINF
jgi:hypothetical protein